VTGPLTVRGALAIALLALGGAVAAAVPLGRMLLGAVSAIAALSLAYSLRLKDTVLAGNVVVALLASTPVTIGAAATGRVGPSAIVAQVSVFLFMLGFEVIKTGCDVDGDGRAGLRTIATVHGVMPTASVAAAAVVGFFIAALALTAYAAVPIAYLAIIATTAVVPAVIALLRLLPASTPAQLRRAFVPMRWAWFGGVASLMLV
jgi:geranylgeranylglycerol-phosphate geranylgeranyltransferase